MTACPGHCCGIVGAGNSAHALASYLAQQGNCVHIYARNPERLEHLKERGSVRATGKIEGEFPLSWVGVDPEAFCGRCPTLFVCTTADVYPEVVERIGPYLEPGQEVVLFSSKLGGSLLFEQRLRQLKRRDVRVIETDSLFACRLMNDRSVWVRGHKQWTLFSCPRRSQTERNAPIIQRFFPTLEPAENLVQRGLTDFGALAHALTVLINMNDIDRAQDFLFYYEGFTERTVALLEALENEFRSIAEAYGTTLLPACEWLNRYYGCQTGSLLEAMRSVPNYRFSQAPAGLETRYIHEDVPCTLVPASQLAHRAGLRTPVMDSVISMASVLSGRDFQATGRTLEDLGWGDYGPEEIRHWMAC